MNSLQRSPALLTRSEIDYLLNKKHVDPNYEYVIRHRIKEKLDRFIQLEIPLLEKASFLQNPVRNLQHTVSSGNMISSSNFNNLEVKMGSVGFEPYYVMGSYLSRQI